MNSNTHSPFTSPPFSSLADLKGLKVTVMGLGLNGGGLATARFFAEHGARVTVTDKKTEEELAPSVAALSDLPAIKLVLEKHEISDFQGADLVIKNPGVKIEGNEYLVAARSIETDVSVFLRFTRSPIIAVTGSKGKSSTVSAMQHALKACGYNSFLGGNITVSPLTFLHKTDENTPVVLELSSWQLADLKGRSILRPRVAVITPIMSDHQNWYCGMESYVADKKLIYADMDSSSCLLCNADDGWGPIFARETNARVHWYGGSAPEPGANGAWLCEDGTGIMRHNGVEHTILSANLAVKGTHMRQNLLNAAQALILFGAESNAVRKALETFPGIEHRLEFFHEEGGVRYYNDSAATIPEAVAAALQSFESPILLTGGTDKELDFAPLAERAHLAKRIYLLSGSGTDKLVPLLEGRGITYSGPYSTLEAMVKAVKEDALDGDSVLFSPGATSFGMFKNEFDRGTKFRNLVYTLKV